MPFGKRVRTHLRWLYNYDNYNYNYNIYTNYNYKQMCRQKRY